GDTSVTTTPENAGTDTIQLNAAASGSADGAAAITTDGSTSPVDDGAGISLSDAAGSAPDPMMNTASGLSPPALATTTVTPTVTTTTTTTTTTPAPVASQLSPTSGPSAGGTIVTIIGSGFKSGATVTFGG